MSDYDEFDDCDRDEFDDDSVADNWEDEDEEQENKKIEEERKKEEEKAQKEAAAAKKREERERREAMAGRLEADENDAVELDGAAAREFKDRLDQHEVELAYESTNTFSSKPIHSMQPTTPEEFAQMGEKIGGCMKTFHTTKFFGFSLNLLLQKACENMTLEQTQELSKKINVVISERTKQVKEGAKKKETTDKYVTEDDTSRGNLAMEGAGEGRNDLKGDGVDLDDFM